VEEEAVVEGAELVLVGEHDAADGAAAYGVGVGVGAGDGNDVALLGQLVKEGYGFRAGAFNGGGEIKVGVEEAAGDADKAVAPL
jgi:hypothetical protein